VLTILLGRDWTANRDAILKRVTEDVTHKQGKRVLIVPELISHDMERRLCVWAGDTASRFAEVLTFSRLAKRVSDAVGFGINECLDNGGRLVAMASATRQLHSKLKAYAAVETRPEFLSGLIEAVDEFKRCCIRSEDLMTASKNVEGSFAQKLEELSLILEAYNSICARGKKDPRDQMTWLLEQLEDSTFASEYTFYIDGFPDFTRQHTEIIQFLISNSENVTVSFTCDQIDSDHPAFSKAGCTAGELLRFAQLSGIKAQVVEIEPYHFSIRKILPNLFQGHISNDMNLQCELGVYQTDSMYQECHAAAEQILHLLSEGNRYRDISITCTDMTAYRNTLSMVFSRYKIPVYLSGTEEILDKTVITTVLAAIDAVVGGFEQSDVLRYLRSPLSPLDVLSCDRIENYAILWGITGKRWENKWENHPDGLGGEWNEKSNKALEVLVNDRNKAMFPLFQLAKDLHIADTVSQQVFALYHFLEALELDQRLLELANELDAQGDYRNGQILNQLWDILLLALEQLVDMLGDTKWELQTFTRLLRLLLSQYDVGTIPASLDAVTVGPVSAMRCHQTKHLIVIGASEGKFPSYSGSKGVLTDQERVTLRKLGVTLTGGAMEGLQAEFAEIYGVFCAPSDTVTVFCSGGQPSYLFRRLRDMTIGTERYLPIGIATSNPIEVSGLLVRTDEIGFEKENGLFIIYNDLNNRKKNKFENIQEKTVEKIYGKQLNLSASQVDKLADCRLAYFLKYGLRLKERKPASIDPAEFGTYIHSVLEKTGREIMKMGGFHQISLEDTLNIADHYSKEYILERFSQIDSRRIEYMLQRNTRELQMVVTELWDELRQSSFEPAAFELYFGVDGALDPIYIAGKSMSAQLRGFVDRVDIWKQGDQSYYRVVDYKSGKKDFDYCDVFNGLGLQMLLYLFALESRNNSILGSCPTAAGVQYFPARVPIISVEGHPDDEEALVTREKLWKRKGLLLADESVLNAMEPADQPKRLSYTRRKDGTISGDLADKSQLTVLKRYIFDLLGKMVDDIASGCVEPNPYTRGNRHNACAFCPYDPVCHSVEIEGRRDYAAMSSKEFWEYINKEMKDRG